MTIQDGIYIKDDLFRDISTAIAELEEQRNYFSKEMYCPLSGKDCNSRCLLLEEGYIKQTSDGFYEVVGPECKWIKSILTQQS